MNGRYTVSILNIFYKAFFVLPLLFFPFFANAATPTLSVYPQSVIQGEPVEIVVQNTASSSVKSISFNGPPAGEAGKNLGVFSYQNKPTALVGVDINQKPATYKIYATMSDGTILEKDLVVGARTMPTVAFSIPEKLGGNATSSAVTLATTLARENAELIGLKTGTKAFWTNKFIFPLPQITVTDPYGYLRDTSGVSITHKGTDFRASIGTPVEAMNRGVVRLTKRFTEYGNTIIVDHGLGLMTFYMHLSKINVNVGELVQQGQVIGLSGETGDALAPHLHITVRMSDISIDPMKFMNLFK